MTHAIAVAVFGSSQTVPGSAEWNDAEHVGRRLAESSIAVITGGYGGTMEAVSKGASAARGHVIGITAPSVFPGRQGSNPFVKELIEANSLTDRIGLMLDRAAGAVALPGSIGTAAELLIAWNHNHIARRNGRSVVPTTAVGVGWATMASSLASENDGIPVDIHLVADSDTGLDWLLTNI